MGSQPWFRLGDKQKQRHKTSIPRQPSFNTFVINSLGSCSRQWAPAQSNLHMHLEPVERTAGEDEGPAEEAGTSGRSAEVQVPLKLRLTGSPNGKPDLQLQLFSLKLGEAACRPSGKSRHMRPHLSEAAKTLESAAALLFLQLIFPDSVPAVARRLAWIGAVSAGAQATARAAPRQHRDRLERSLRHGSTQAMRRLESRVHLCSDGLQGASKVVGHAANWVERYSSAAAGLVVAASFWSVLHPPSYHLLRCIAAALPVWAGYAETSRACASGRVPDGPPAEGAWRARHKWAAQRLAHLLSDAHERPPLAPAFNLLETLTMNIGLAVDGMAVGSFAMPAFAVGSPALESATSGRGWAAPGPGSAFSIVGSLRTHTPDPSGPAETSGRADASAEKSKGAVQGPVVWDMSKQEWVPASKKPKQAAGPRSPRSGEAARPPGSGAAAESVAINRTGEGFATSSLPTIRSQEELEAYQRLHAGARPASQGHREPAGQQSATTPRATDPDTPGPGPGSPGNAAAQGSGQELALYGQADHMDFNAELSLGDRAKMAARAAYLIAIFLPFLLLAPLLFLLASLLLRWDSRRSGPPLNGDRHAVNGEEAVAGQEDSQIGLRRALVAADEAAAKAPATAGNADHVEEISRPDMAGRQASTSAPEEDSWALALAARLRMRAWRLLLFGIRNSGAAFIKWGQWSATREDLFPQDVCMVLAELHDRAPVHSWEASKVQIEEAFGKPVEELFDSIDHAALASGSIAQVHRAVLQLGGEPRQVVVKVRHPNVARNITIDFRLLKPVAAAASRVPSLKGLSLKESLAQFSANMTAQTDLRVEAVHLRRFYNNFAAVRSSVTPPLPVPGMATEAVLVETFEAGESVAKYIRQPSPYNTQIVALGVDTYLKMLLHDNFVHTDLHPGNILVRVRPTGKAAGDGAAETTTLDDILMKPIRRGQAKAQLQLILLDFGLAEELTPRVRKHFISFLHAISKGDGAAGTRHMLAFGKAQTCPDPAAFQHDMTAMFRRECNIYSKAGVDVDQVLKSALHLARKHEVVIDSSYAALVVGVCVIVGFATALDPALNLIDAATSAFFINDLTGRIAGRLYT